MAHVSPSRFPAQSSPPNRMPASCNGSYVKPASRPPGGRLVTTSWTQPWDAVYRHVSCDMPPAVTPPNRRTQSDHGRYAIPCPARGDGPEELFSVHEPPYAYSHVSPYSVVNIEPPNRRSVPCCS